MVGIVSRPHQAVNPGIPESAVRGYRVTRRIEPMNAGLLAPGQIAVANLICDPANGVGMRWVGTGE